MSENARARIERFEQDILLLQTRLAKLEGEVARLGGKPLRYVPEAAVDAARARWSAESVARAGSVPFPKRPHTDDELARLVARRRVHGFHGSLEHPDQHGDVSAQGGVSRPDRHVEQAFEEGHALGQVEDRVLHPADGRGQVVFGFGQRLTAFRRWLRAGFSFRHRVFPLLGRGGDGCRVIRSHPAAPDWQDGCDPSPVRKSPIPIEEVRP